MTGYWFESVSLPALIRAARGPYRHSIQAALAEAGFDDVPRNGPYVLGGLAARTAADPDSTPLADLIRQLAVSKQVAGQLIDTLVTRGYLDRHPDPDDRRRLTVRLTERGQAAAATVRSGVADVDRRLADRLTADEIYALRRGLAVLANIAEDED